MAVLCGILLGLALGGSLVYGLLSDRITAYKARSQDLRHQLNDMQANFGDRLQDSLRQQRLDYEAELAQLKAQLFRAQFRADAPVSSRVEQSAKAS